MANILDRYGIKEVADCCFYKIDETTHGPGELVLYLDTLKVSTIEQTAELAEAKGGKGNPSLIAWDYGKEITVSLEDALFSAKSMAIMYGDESKPEDAEATEILKTMRWTATSASMPEKVKVTDSEFTIAKDEDENPLVKLYDIKTGASVSTPVANTEYLLTATLQVGGTQIVISAEQFPGTYYVTGDTYARSEATGEDEFFQFIIPKAKVQSENTLTLEAEGDPSVFSMNLKVLRPADGVMMKLVKYDVASS